MVDGWMGEEPDLPDHALNRWRRLVKAQLVQMERFTSAQQTIAKLEQEKQALLRAHKVQSNADRVLEAETAGMIPARH